MTRKLSQNSRHSSMGQTAFFARIVYRSIRDGLARMQNGRCFYCAETFGDGPLRLTYDHIKLASDGGDVSIENGVASCKQCNWIRGDMPFHDYCADLGIDPHTRLRELQEM